MIESMRQDFIERIDHRNKLMGFDLGSHEANVARATRQFEEHILQSGMTFGEALQVLDQMHLTNMRMVRRARDKSDTASKEV